MSKKASEYPCNRDKNLTPLRSVVGDWLGSERKHRGYSIKHVATLTGLTTTTVRRTEFGYRVPSEDTVRRMALALGLDEAEAFERLCYAHKAVQKAGGLKAYAIIKGSRLNRCVHIHDNDAAQRTSTTNDVPEGPPT